MFASLTAKQCTLKNDECRNTAEFKSAGQNIFWTTDVEAYNESIALGVDGWWYESSDANEGDIASYENKKISEFATMAQDHTSVIGCAASVYTREDNSEIFFLVCNYSFSL